MGTPLYRPTCINHGEDRFHSNPPVGCTDFSVFEQGLLIKKKRQFTCSEAINIAEEMEDAK